MRFSHWLKTVASALLLTATAGPALAQGPAGPGSGPPMFQPAYGASDPGVLYPQGVPQGYQPYPAISPYGNIGFDQTYRDNDGLWFQRILNTDREWFGSLDVTYNTIKNPGNRELGSPHIPIDPITGGLLGYNIPTYGQGGEPLGGVGFGGLGIPTIPNDRVIVDDRVIPYPLNILAPTFAAVQLNANIYPIRGLNEFGDYKSTGLQGGLGFFNEDGTGMSVNGFWSGNANQSFTMGQESINGIPITQEIIDATNGRLLFFRNGAIPLDWGFSSSLFLGGITGHLGTAKYDLLYHMDTKSTAIGSDLNYYMTPVVDSGAIKVRPLIGGRYMSIDDQFRFHGIDSGFNYDFLITSSTGGVGGAAAANTYRPLPGTQFAVYDMVDATLNNSVQSNLAGPQVGLRYDFGSGDGFKIWGQSVVGLMGNQENYNQSGNNIGDELGLLLFSNGLDMLATDARFNSKRTVSHVSPLFEQTFMAEMKILEMIPLVRKLPGIDNTVFRVGYTATVVGNVAQAGESIDWRGFPDFPSISPSRETWWMSRWNFGIEKRF